MAGGDIDFEAAPLEVLERQITEFAGQLAAAECEWLSMVAEFDRRRGFESWQLRSTAEWLSWRCGLAPVAAREKVRVARALNDLPAITSAFSEGRLSYSKVRALARVATPATDAEFLLMAEHSTAAQLEVMCRSYARYGPGDG